jgi:hypothetical protein
MVLDNFFRWVLGVVVRLVMLLAGLVFFAGLLSVAGLILLVWLVRALWARLTGQPVSAWTFQINRQAVWDRFYHAPGARAGRASEPVDDRVVDVDSTDVSIVTDVEPKQIKSQQR